MTEFKLTPKTLLSGAAALAFALSASVAYAQDADEAKPDPTETEGVMDTADAAEETMDAAEALEDESSDRMAEEPVMLDADVETEPRNPMSGTVTCPEGTELQSDDSCMIVGDWDMEDAEEAPEE